MARGHDTEGSPGTGGPRDGEGRSGRLLWNLLALSCFGLLMAILADLSLGPHPRVSLLAVAALLTCVAALVTGCVALWRRRDVWRSVAGVCLSVVVLAGMWATASLWWGSSLHWAASTGSVTLCRLAVGLGGAVSEERALRSHAGACCGTEIGRTPLHVAVKNGDVRVARFLLKAGADPQVNPKSGPSTLELPAMGEHWDVIRLLLQHGADVNADIGGGATVLHRAAPSHDRPELVAFWLTHGANIEALTETGQTPLHWAAWGGSTQNALVLLEAGARVDGESATGETPLHLAAGSAFPDTVRVLLQAGADVNAQDHSGNTPLHAAASADRRGMVRLLLEAGALPGVRNDNGQTPLDVALRRGNDDVAELLRAHGSRTAEELRTE